MFGNFNLEILNLQNCDKLLFKPPSLIYLAYETNTLSLSENISQAQKT